MRIQTPSSHKLNFQVYSCIPVINSNFAFTSKHASCQILKLLKLLENCSAHNFAARTFLAFPIKLSMKHSTKLRLIRAQTT